MKKCQICGCQLKGRQRKYCSTQCKIEGHKATKKQYNADNKEQIAEKRKQWYINNPDYDKQRYIDNKEKFDENAKQYRSDNKEKKAQYYIDNKEKITKKNKQWKVDNKEKIKQHYIDNKEKKADYYKQHYEDHRDPNTPRQGSDEYRIKLSAAMQGISIEKWDGFTARDHVLPLSQCTKLNKKFEGSNAHHIMSGVVIFIPKDLHESIRHNFKSGKNMNEINQLAWTWLTQK